MKKLFLVDAYALIYRCYYAFLGRPMRNAAGVNTSAVFGFVKYMRDIILRERPHYFGVAFDTKGDTFRHELFPAYKANRAETPEDIHASVPYIKEILHAMRIPVLEQQGWEADDVIGTLACKASAAGFEVYMVTPDKDFGQLVRPGVAVYKQKKNGEGVEIVGPDQIREQWGIDDPRLVADILALWGDASDNIPGVAGIGEKGAAKLVSQWGTVENILENIDEIKGRQHDSILEGREQLLLSKRLATIDTDAPVDFVPERLAMEPADAAALGAIYRELGFTMFLREMESGVFPPVAAGTVAVGTQDAPTPPAAPVSPVPQSAQGSLFDEVGTATAVSSPQGDLFADEGLDTIETTPHNYITVDDPDSLRDVVAELTRSGGFCFDTETTGFDPLGDRLIGVSLAVRPFEAWWVPLGGDRRGELLDILRPVFEDPEIAKTGQNLKFDAMVMRSAGITVRGFMYDTMLLHYLLDPESRHGMNHLARTFLNYAPVEIESLIGRGARQITMDMVAPARVAEYAAEDADVTLRLKDVLWPRVVEQGLEKLYREIEEPMIGVLAEMETVGVRIDTAMLADYGRTLAGKLAGLEDKIRELTGEPALNVNSARQLGEALFGKMRIDPKPKKTKTKQYSTDEEYLQSLADRSPVVGLVLEYRGLKKLLSTYIEALPMLVNPATGRVHTSFNQAVTSTGRLSSSNPNLQNIPIRDQEGREIRRAFVPADPDHLLLSADYSQVELRLMAHLSGDEALIGAFRAGEDIHTATAARLFGVPAGQVTPEQRRRAKTANFGIIYGISPFGLAQRLNIPRAEAGEIIDGYFRSYPGVKRYMEQVVARARDEGYVSTLFGRKRYLPDIRSGNPTTRGLAERNAINAPLQGSAADIMKIAMIRTARRLKEEGLRSRLILQVHDELVIDLYRPEQERVAALVVDAMEHAAALAVDLTVDYGVGSNWLEAH